MNSLHVNSFFSPTLNEDMLNARQLMGIKRLMQHNPQSQSVCVKPTVGINRFCVIHGIGEFVSICMKILNSVLDLQTVLHGNDTC